MALNRTHGTAREQAQARHARRQKAATVATEIVRADVQDWQDETVAQQYARLVGTMEDMMAHAVLRAGSYQLCHVSTGRVEVRADGDIGKVLCEGDVATCAAWVCARMDVPTGSRIFRPARLPAKYR